MNINRHSGRRVRAALVTAAAASAGLAGALGMGGVAHASVHHADGFVTETSCTSVFGKISYSPGLLKTKARSVTAVLTGTTAGCSNLFDGPLPGTGTMTAILKGTDTLGAENLSGTFTINWPAGSGYNPSDGTLSVTDTNGVEQVYGTVSSGFETGAEVAMQYVTTGNTGAGTAKHPVKAQTYTNTQSLTLSENTG
jgi:hypothetical protein